MQKLQNAFTHDRHELDHRLQAWVKQIVENPAQRLKPARDGLNKLIEKLVGQIEATPARVASVRLRRDEIRKRYAGSGITSAGGNRRGLSQLLRGLPRETSLPADDVCAYSQLLIEEASLHARAEILGTLLARASQVGEELNRLQQGVETVERSFAARTPRFRNSHRRVARLVRTSFSPCRRTAWPSSGRRSPTRSVAIAALPISKRDSTRRFSSPTAGSAS